MVLLQISEPGESTPTHQSRQLAVGIDLGTTNSLVAHFDGNEIRVLKDDAGRAAMPSVVYFGADHTKVGAAAEAAQLAIEALFRKERAIGLDDLECSTPALLPGPPSGLERLSKEKRIEIGLKKYKY